MKRPVRNRRKNWHLRQLLSCAYGASLLCAIPYTGHAQSLNTDKSALKSRAIFNIQQAKLATTTANAPRLVLVGIEAWGTSTDALREGLQRSWAVDNSYRKKFLDHLAQLDPDQLDYQLQPLQALKDGLSFDYQLSQNGALHLNLYDRDDAETRGMRVPLNRLDASQTNSTGPRWSLGVSMEVARSVDGDRMIAPVPQLLLDLDGLLGSGYGHGTHRHFEAAFQYGLWHTGSSGRALNVRVAQAFIRMTF
jgi:hypothetical protein